jgi:hypothetical protein
MAGDAALAAALGRRMDAWFPVLNLVLGVALNELLTFLRAKRRERAEAKERQRSAVRGLLEAAHSGAAAALSAQSYYSRQEVGPTVGSRIFTPAQAEMSAAAVRLKAAAVWVTDADLRKSAMNAAGYLDEPEDGLMDAIHDVIDHAETVLRRLED